MERLYPLQTFGRLTATGFDRFRFDRSEIVRLPSNTRPLIVHSRGERVPRVRVRNAKHVCAGVFFFRKPFSLRTRRYSNVDRESAVSCSPFVAPRDENNIQRRV